MTTRTAIIRQFYYGTLFDFNIIWNKSDWNFPFLLCIACAFVNFYINYPCSLQVAEGLGFLHRDAKMMHNNICPSSIIINKYGSWKLAGFDFCVANISQQDQAVSTKRY